MCAERTYHNLLFFSVLIRGYAVKPKPGGTQTCSRECIEWAFLYDSRLAASAALEIPLWKCIKPVSVEKGLNFMSIGLPKIQLKMLDFINYDSALIWGTTKKKIYSNTLIF